MHCETLRGGAVVARRAHNPEVAGSSPAPATNSSQARNNQRLRAFCFEQRDKTVTAPATSLACPGDDLVIKQRFPLQVLCDYCFFTTRISFKIA